MTQVIGLVMANVVNIPLTETFQSPNWGRYGTAASFTSSSVMGRESTASYPWSLSTLNHLDVRTFNVGNSLDTPENWNTVSGVTLGPDSTFNNWRALKASLTSGTAVTLTSIAEPLDLTAVGDPTTTYLQSALNNYALLNLGSSYIALSSDEGQTWSQQTLTSLLETGTGIVHGLLSLFETANLDLTAVNGVRIHLVPTSTGTFTMIGLRVVDPNYKPSTVMFDTWNGILRQDIPFDGNIAENPPAVNQQLPIIYYAADTGGTDDPQPIDATFSVFFNTGSNVGTNLFQFNMRQVGGTDTSSLLLDGQTQLSLAGPQPGLVQVAEIPRTMADFQGQPLSVLQGQSMLDLDATALAVTNSYTVFQIVWGTNQLITVADSVSLLGGQYLPYVWNYPGLSPYTAYQAVCTLEENSIRVQIYNVNQITLAQSSLLFDSGAISDSYQFPRRPGRIGWSASFTDGEAHLISIRPERTLFAEYQSTPLNSRTPVKGVQVYANYSPDIELWNDFTASSADNANPIVSLDSKRSITGSATKVYINQAVAGQGVISNVLSQDDISGITEWAEVEIKFSVWVPSAAAQTETTTLQVNLVSDTGWSVPLGFPNIQYNTWQPISFAGPDIPSGLYQLQIIYPGVTSMTFWVDAVSVTQRTLSWGARANQSDPWVPFNGLTSDNAAGILINRGTQLQIRAQAKRQDAAILSKPKIKPTFAQLGKAVWPEDISAAPDPNATALTASFSYAHVSGRTYSFTYASQPYVTQWIWQLSDGTIMTGPNVSHTFSALAPSGTYYQVTLTTVDAFGTRATNTETISVA